MDEEKAHSHLERAERDVADAHRRIARQRELIRALQASGHDTATAEAVLQSLTVTAEAMENHRRIILEELGLYNDAALRLSRDLRRMG
jgi:hypothetical protein